MGTLAVAALAVACSDDPTGARQGDVARVALSQQRIDLDVGETSTQFAEALDARGTALSTLPQVASANAAIAAVSLQQESARSPSRRHFTVTAVGYGATRVVASVGVMADTALVVTYPASLEITGAGDTLASGSTTQLGVECFDTQGSLVTPLEGAESFSWSTYDARVAEVDAAGLLFAKQPGRVAIAARLPNGTADAIAVDVVPGSFRGTASATAGPSATVVTYTVGAGQPSWDNNTQVLIGGQRAFIMSDSDESDLITAIPFGLQAGAAPVLFEGIGRHQVALETTFAVDALATADDLEPNNYLDGTPPTSVTLPFEDVLSVDGVDHRDYFAFTLTEDTTTVHLFLDWDIALNGDLDLLVADAGFTTLPCEVVTAGRANPEQGACDLPAGDYLLVVDNYDARSTGNPNLVNYHIRVRAP
jgi:hypothetical protein